MKVVIDIEANSLDKPTEVWVIVCKEVETGELHVFRHPTGDRSEAERFLRFSDKVTHWIGHNWLEYDWPVLNRLLGLEVRSVARSSTDTLILSRLVDYPRCTKYARSQIAKGREGSPADSGRPSGQLDGRPVRPDWEGALSGGEEEVLLSRGGHSIEAYGEQFGLPKQPFSDFTRYSKQMEDYCVRDVEICSRIYDLYKPVWSDPAWSASILLEHQFQLIVNDLHTNGFSFNSDKANKLLTKVNSELAVLDSEILNAFPARLRPVREIHPRTTRYGTLNKSDFRFVKSGDLSEYNGGPFTRCDWQVFNPSSHKQIIGVLNAAGWKPTDKTKTHLDAVRAIRNTSNSRRVQSEETLDISERLDYLKEYGWKVNENNLSTLPNDAPAGARLLARRILVESRRRTLTEWVALCRDDGRIHGRFYGIGAWTHRMAHQHPNTANIPTEAKLYGHEMRALWRSPKGRLLVGVDAEGIQLRIFAHYIDDPEFTEALVNGKKSDKSDPHSLNQRIIGDYCKTRQHAKRFIYAYLLGAGVGKLAEVLECSRPEAETALDRVLARYTGLDRLRSEVIPRDAKRGYFEGLDGRRVPIPGDTGGDRRHLCMSGYLQCGEAVVMKAATVRFYDSLKEEKALLVNLVHDEWQTESPSNSLEVAVRIAVLQTDALILSGRELGLKCPMAGSYWNDDRGDYTIGTNWSITH